MKLLGEWKIPIGWGLKLLKINIPLNLMWCKESGSYANHGVRNLEHYYLLFLLGSDLWSLITARSEESEKKLCHWFLPLTLRGWVRHRRSDDNTPCAPRSITTVLCFEKGLGNTQCLTAIYLRLHSNLTFKKDVNVGQPSAPSYILSRFNPHLNILTLDEVEGSSTS